MQNSKYYEKDHLPKLPLVENEVLVDMVNVI